MEFKDIPGYEGYYQCSNTGLIKSLYRVIIRKDGLRNTYKEKILKSTPNRNHYLQVSLHDKYGVRKVCNIHRLVALTFLGEPPLNYVVNHKDKNRQNNNLSNLEFVTPRENVIHGKDKTNTSSKYTGVNKTKYGWRSTATIKGKRTHLGYFKTEEEARDKYLEANKNQ